MLTFLLGGKNKYGGSTNLDELTILGARMVITTVYDRDGCDVLLYSASNMCGPGRSGNEKILHNITSRV